MRKGHEPSSYRAQVLMTLTFLGLVVAAAAYVYSNHLIGTVGVDLNTGDRCLSGDTCVDVPVYVNGDIGNCQPYELFEGFVKLVMKSGDFDQVRQQTNVFRSNELTNVLLLNSNWLIFKSIESIGHGASIVLNNLVDVACSKVKAEL